MRNITFIAIAAAFLAGCTQKEEISLVQQFEKHKVYRKNLSKTEKVQLYSTTGETKALLVATYLYAQTLHKKDGRDEVFIIGVYAEDDIESDFAKSEYTLTLNGQLPREVQKLNPGDARLKDVSFVVEWGSYYLMTFPHVESKSFDLVFESKEYTRGTLHFAKVAKYVLTQKAY